MDWMMLKLAIIRGNDLSMPAQIVEWGFVGKVMN